MKKTSQYISLIILVLSLTNCSDFLDKTDPDTINSANFYYNQNDMEGALISVYATTRGFYNEMFVATEMKSDNTTTTNIGGSGAYSNFCSHGVTSTDQHVKNIYNNLYFTIARANLLLSHIDDKGILWKAQTTDSISNEKASLHAQAKFLRALSNFYLVRLFGPVPVIDKPVKSKEQSLTLIRQPVIDAYSLIISDLQEVANSTVLPTFSGGTAKLGRVTNTAGAALLGKVYLTMAATLHTQYPNLPDSTQNWYNEAIYYLNKSMNLNGVTVDQTTYKSNLTTQTLATTFGLANQGCDEIIYEIMYSADASNNSPFASYFQPAQGLLTPLAAQSLNLGESNLYSEYELTGKSYTANDIRISLIAGYNNNSVYYTKKYIDLTNTTYSANCWIELRFADVFLMLAEAYEQTGQTSLAKVYLNAVRTTHGKLKDYDTSITNATYSAKYPTLRDAIFHERRVELSFENQRWFDLLRQYPVTFVTDANNHVTEIQADAFVSHMQSITSTIGGIANKYTNFNRNEILLPIPYDEISTNHNFYQNPGY